MKLNWKVRFRNKQFLASLVALILVFANQLAGMFGMDITVYSDQITNITETVLMILALMGIVVDPTTEGMSDSERVLNRKDGE